MKNILLILCSILPMGIYAQTLAQFWNADMRQIAKPGSSPGWIFIKDGLNLDPTTVLSDEADALLLDSDDDFVLFSTHTDGLGLTHYKYQQEYDGVPVEFSTVAVHADGDETQSITGEYVVGLSLSTTPTISGSTAISTALSYVGATTYAWSDPTEEANLQFILDDPMATHYPTPQLVITYDDEDNVGSAADYVLAYKIPVYALSPLSQQYIYVDAGANTVLRTAPYGLACSPTSNACTEHNGTQSINTFEQNPNEFVLVDNCGPAVLLTASVVSGAWGLYVDTDNDWTDANVPCEATSAHWALTVFDDYIRTVHGRSGYNNANGQSSQIVGGPWTRFLPQTNNTGFVFLGDISSTTYFITLDIVGHEWGHGVMYTSAGLVGTSESFALGEGFADVFGVLNEFHGQGGIGDWTIGEDLGLPGVRNLADPSSNGFAETYATDANWDASSSPDYYVNGAVAAYWFYLLSEGGMGTNANSDNYNIAGIGRTDAADILYRAIDIYMGNITGFVGARDATIRAAMDLFGSCSVEVETTIAAWDAVGVPVGALTSGTAVADVEVCGTIDASTAQTLYIASSNITAPCSSPGAAYLTIEASAAPIEFISGADIYFGPGTYFEAGVDLHAHISNVCTTPPLKTGNDGSLDNTQAIGNQTVGEQVMAYTVYPNPSHQGFTVSLDLEENSITEIALFDLYGRSAMIVLSQNELSKGNHEISISDEGLAAGVYLLQVTINNSVSTFRIVKL